MKRITTLLVVSALLVGLVLAGTSYAERGRGGSGSSFMDRGRPGPPPPFSGIGRGPGHDGPPGAGFGMGIPGGLIEHPEVQKKLGLTEDQVAQLRAKRVELEKRRIQLQAECEIARIEMEELVKASELDKTKIEEQIDKLGELHKEQVRGMVDQILAVHEILDSTQLEKVRSFLEKMRGHHGSGMKGKGWAGEDRPPRARNYRDGKQGRREGPPEGRRPGSGPHRRDRGDRPEGPPPPREGRAFPPGPPEGAPYGLGQAPNPFGPPPGGFPPPRPEGSMEEDGGFADLGPALDAILNSEE